MCNSNCLSRSGQHRPFDRKNDITDEEDDYDDEEGNCDEIMMMVNGDDENMRTGVEVHVYDDYKDGEEDVSPQQQGDHLCMAKGAGIVQGNQAT